MRYIHSGLATPAATFEDDARIAHRVGADGLELAVAKLPAALERLGPGGLAAALKRPGVRAVSVAALSDVTFPDLARLEAMHEALHRAAEVARAGGAWWIVVTPGERPDGCDEREALREGRETLGRLARIVERYDVGLALCPLGRPWASIRTLEHALTILEAVGRKALGLAPDTFEAWAAGTAPEALKACPPRWLAMLRLADAPSEVTPETAREHHRRPPGAGAVPLTAWLALARALVPDVPVTCPVAATDAATAPEDWARRLREQVLGLEPAAAARRA